MKHLNEYSNYTFSDQDYSHSQKVYLHPREAFIKACESEDVETIKDLLKHPQIDVTIVNSQLAEAIAELIFDTIYALWDYPGLDLQDHGEQLGCMSAMNGADKTLKFVLDTDGFDPSAHHNSILKYANDRGSSKCIALLLDDERILKTIGNIEFGNIREELMNQLLKKLELDTPEELKNVMQLML